MNNPNVRRSLLIALAAGILGCGSEDPTMPPFGSELSVAEQVAIQVAFEKVADSLDLKNTPIDSVIADFTRVAARLVRLEGRYGTINVQLPGATAAVPLRAVAVTSSGAGSEGQTLLAWENLDVASFTVQRALLIQSGGFAGTTAAQMRYLDMTGTSGTQGYYAGGGTLTLSAASFTNNCTGLDNTDEESCRAGKVTVTGEGNVTKTGGATSTITVPASTISAFEVIVAP